MCRTAAVSRAAPGCFSARRAAPARAPALRCAASKETELKELENFKNGVAKNLEAAAKGKQRGPHFPLEYRVCFLTSPATLTPPSSPCSPLRARCQPLR